MVFQFHAHVDDDAISKVSRLFNASLTDILNELLQNARCSGATKVHIDRVSDQGLGAAIRVADDGPGVDDPETLFSLGRSAWDANTKANEDAAGMGFFALANRGARIIVQKRGTDHSWIVDANSEAFSGKALITAEPGPSGHRGMTIVFPQQKDEYVASAVERAARYYPLDVFFDGNALDREDFLANAEHVEEWNGIRIGVYRMAAPAHRHLAHNANFHGVTLHVPLPSLSQQFHRCYHARIDVVRCSDLKLVLPARKEVVQTELLEQLQARISKIYYQLVQKAGAHSLNYCDYSIGQELGVDLPEAIKLLRPFSPGQADDCQSYKADPEQVHHNGYLYIEAEGSVEEQNVARAVEQSPEMDSVYEPVSGFVGYEWYDEMLRFKLKGYGAVLEGQWYEVSPEEELFAFSERPDVLAVVIEVSDRHKELCLETDVLVLSEDYASLDGAQVHVTASSDITPSELTNFLAAALFSPSDDVEAGSYDQQCQWFNDEAEDLAYTLLVSSMAADMKMIARVIQREVAWRLPKGCEATISIKDREVSIDRMDVPGPATRSF